MESQLSDPNDNPYDRLSPFEVRELLLDAAEKGAEERRSTGQEAEVLDASRGNPNFLNTAARDAYNLLGLFANGLAREQTPQDMDGLLPPKEEIYQKFDEYLDGLAISTGFRDTTTFLRRAIDYVDKELGIAKDEFVAELVDASLGGIYPTPPRMLPAAERVAQQYSGHVLMGEDMDLASKFDVFATEGATAGIVYTLNSLKVNRILHQGDKIALFTPTYSPYLELPGLAENGFEVVALEGSQESEWQIDDAQIEKLKDPEVKALFLVNPTNPTSVNLSQDSLEKIADLIKTERQDLIVMTDTVYANFIDEFDTLLTEVPRNTIGIYSYSKYFGATGWRLGTVMLHEDNIIDEKIAALPQEDKDALWERYKIKAADPEQLKFIDRIELDSRSVSLSHTGGLSTPQQAMMTLFGLYDLVDDKQEYRQYIQDVLKGRHESLYTGLGSSIPPMATTNYYTLIDVADMAEKKYGTEFREYLEKNLHPVEFLEKMAHDSLTVLLPGMGFAAPRWTVRVSLANLQESTYEAVGQNVLATIDDLHDEYQAPPAGGGAPVPLGPYA